MGRKRPHPDTTAWLARSGGARNSQIDIFFEVPYKQSGNGREWGRFGLEEFLEVKAVAGWGS